MAGVKGAGNVTVTYNSNEITNYLSQVQLQGVISELEATHMGSTAEEYVPGLASWSATIDLIGWDSTVDGYLAPDIVSPGTKRTCAIAFTNGGTTVTYTWTSEAFITSFSLQAAPSEIIGAAGIQLRLNGAPARATS